MSAANETKVSVFLDPTTHKQAKHVATDQSLSLSRFIEKVVVQYLSDREQRATRKRGKTAGENGKNN